MRAEELIHWLREPFPGIKTKDGHRYSGRISGQVALEAADLLTRLTAERDEARARAERLQAERDTPETADWLKGVMLEAAHQRERWGVDHDAGKAPEDWFWLIGYLAGKALHAAKAGDQHKAAHHTISTAAALANWHLAITGTHTDMRPGIMPPPALTQEATDGQS